MVGGGEGGGGEGGGGEGGGGTDGGGGVGAVAPGGQQGGGGEGGVEGGVKGGVEGGEGGGGGGGQSRVNVCVREEPYNIPYGPYCSGAPHCAVHSPPFQPSPHESNIASVQSAWAYTPSSVPEAGAPPDPTNSPSHVSVHEISYDS